MAITLLLLPGLDGTGLLFDRFVAALPADITPKIISYPGDEVLTYNELRDYVRVRLPSGEFAVLGESFSGPLALRLAAIDSRVSAVILCASFVRNPIRFLPRCASIFAFPFCFRFLPQSVTAKTLLGGYSTEEICASLERAHAMVMPRVFAARVREVMHVDAREDLRNTSIPILYLAGEGDRLVRRHNFDAIRKIRPDVEYVRIKAPHLVLQTEPQESARRLRVFYHADPTVRATEVI